MGVQTIYDYLQRRRGWYSVRQISNGLGIGETSVSRSLRILLKRSDVVKKLNDFKAPVYRCSGL